MFFHGVLFLSLISEQTDGRTYIAKSSVASGLWRSNVQDSHQQQLGRFVKLLCWYFKWQQQKNWHWYWLLILITKFKHSTSSSEVESRWSKKGTKIYQRHKKKVRKGKKYLCMLEYNLVFDFSIRSEPYLWNNNY